jgi:hypothetical protein
MTGMDIGHLDMPFSRIMKPVIDEFEMMFSEISPFLLVFQGCLLFVILAINLTSLMDTSKELQVYQW